ncbi:hypothetical protein [Ignavibacterium album]|uniref:hypothetical protein n=1 Tax=Ignavibacterium album TaxID=591197 RepID=UPI0035B8206B
MNTFRLLITISLLLCSIGYSQQAKSAIPKDSTNNSSPKIKPAKPTSEHFEEPNQINNNGSINNGIEFRVKGLVSLSFQNWTEMPASEGRVGFGLNGDLFAGAQIDDFYFGLGPNLNLSFLSNSKTVGGYNSTTTYTVTNAGVDFYLSTEGLFVTFGRGYASIDVTVTLDNLSETVNMPEDATYNRVGFGWEDGFLFSITYNSYLDWARNMSRMELNFGYAF